MANAYSRGEKIPVDTLERMEVLYDEGVASQDDWEDFVEYLFGRKAHWPGYIYPNLSALGEAEESEGA